MQSSPPFNIAKDPCTSIWPSTTGSLLYWDRIAILLAIRIDARTKHAQRQHSNNLLDSRPIAAR